VLSAFANATARWNWHLHIALDPARVGLLLAVPGALPWQLAIVGPNIDCAQVTAVLAARRAQLPAGFAVIRVMDGFDVEAGDAPVPFPSAVVHTPATRASLHAALLEVRNVAAETSAAPAADGDGPPLAGMRVLLAEDNPINQTVAIALLEYAGAAVTLAGDGAQALDCLGREPGFDAVLMDVQMPVMDGLAAARAIRTGLRLTLPVIAMTAGVTQEERDACTAAGMDDFIAKPIEEDELVAVLKKYRH
jgi:CheY-like chemotaxis protein